MIQLCYLSKNTSSLPFPDLGNVLTLFRSPLAPFLSPPPFPGLHSSVSLESIWDPCHDSVQEVYLFLTHSNQHEAASSPLSLCLHSSIFRLISFASLPYFDPFLISCLIPRLIHFHIFNSNLTFNDVSAPPQQLTEY